ncbi:MAG TPA: RNA polymerase factor sigma-54 [Sedimentisphaerales bacterium]|nr:RNA polymerase factor sigma-54 [Sedimentisphaerales bacterium]
MKLEMTGQMRMEQRMKLAPHMIQSMEILQLPILALQERIEQELNSNPVLEVEEPQNTDSEIEMQAKSDENDSTREDYLEKTEDFSRFDRIDENFKESINQDESFHKKHQTEEIDKKLEAIKNTEAAPVSLHEYLSNQWRLIDAEESVKIAGEMIIDYIDNRGYLSVRIEQLHNKDRKDFSIDDLNKALVLIQTLEPSGVGARDLQECLLIQMSQNSEDMTFEQKLVKNHMKELLENHLPEIAKKMNCSLDDINLAIKHMSKLDTSPGLQIVQEKNHPISVDVIVYKDEGTGEYIIKPANSNLPNLRVNEYYEKLSKDNNTKENARKFLQNNIRSAQWIIEAIEQRKNTLLKVTTAVVKHQKDFFDKGLLYLKPLPMAKIADDVGVHLATVSRAVAGKYIQCDWGVLPLRKFFSGGTEDTEGETHSWEAIRAILQQIIDEEDKAKPLNDDNIRQKLAEKGIENLARRTVAKYRKLMNIPTARLRKKF